MKRYLSKVLGLSFLHLVILLICSLFIVPHIPFSGFFPYREIALGYHLPNLLTSFANFDGVHYLGIAERGYYQFEQAFFPLYPLLIKLFGFVLQKNLLLSSIFISNVSFVIGLFFLWGIYLSIEKKRAVNIMLLYLAFPTSFFFHISYTESLFLSLFAGSLYFFQKKQWVWAGILGFLSALTRLFGVFLTVLFLYEALLLYKKNKNIRIFLLPLLPLLGLISYMLFLQITTGDPLSFFHAQSVFANRSTHLVLLPQVYYRYIKIFVTADFSFAYYIALVEVLLFSSVLFGSIQIVIREYMKEKRGALPLFLGFFSIVGILLPTLTGTFSSIPRYSLFAFSYFISLAYLSRKAQIAIGLFFLLGQLLLFCFFLQGYFVS